MLEITALTDRDILIQLSTQVTNLRERADSEFALIRQAQKELADRVTELERSEDRRSGGLAGMRWLLNLALALPTGVLAFLAGHLN